MILEIKNNCIDIFRLILNELDDISYAHLMATCKALFSLRGLKQLNDHHQEKILNTKYKSTKLLIGSSDCQLPTYFLYTLFGNIYDKYANDIINNIPSHITHLKIGFYFNKDLNKLPINIKYLEIRP